MRRSGGHPIRFFALLYGGAGIAGALAYLILVQWFPGEHLGREYILALVSRESPVYYNDGQSLLGTFFSQEHRRYVPYDEMPPCLIEAIVSAEDASFFRHPGFNPLAIARAAAANLVASVRSGRLRIVQGGSTLTQQTAKNLYKRKRRSLWEKFKELLNALRLEAHYSKEEILEFYLNQFYVNANGRGVGIASEYFFDKEVSELTLAECAFLAGSVKGPDSYNPAIKGSAEAAERARKRAEWRKNYVLRRMYEEGYLSEADYHRARQESLAFRIGRFRFPRSVVLDEVERRLREPGLRALLEAHGVSDLNTAGLQIVTTLDADIQEAALRAVRHNLSRLKLLLEGYHRPGVEESGPKGEKGAGGEARVRESRVQRLEAGRFYRGTIVRVENDPPGLVLRFGGTEGLIDRPGLLACVGPLQKGVRGAWYRARKRDLRKFLSERSEGELLYASVRREAHGQERARLDCAVEAPPDEPLQGALVVLDRGRYRALVGGTHNTNYNRALRARRQPGSTFKPIVYLAALSLGWSLLDALPNEREVFEFQGTFYFPRPDHHGAPAEVSLAWAGAKSENVASVWLLYHLVERLSEEQLERLAHLVGLAPEGGESPKEYARRIRDGEGVLVTDAALEEAALLAVRGPLATDLVFEGKLEEARALRRLHYGRGFERQQKALAGELARTKSKSRRAELSVRLKLLSRSYLALTALLARCAAATDDTVPPKACGDDPERVGEVFSRKTLERLVRAVEERRADLKPGYALSTLTQVRDFRVLLALRYVVRLARYLGVDTPLEEVLSFPLGTNAVTLIGLARAYQTAGTGRWYGASAEHPTGRAALIKEIRTAGGETIYRLDLPETQAVGEALAAPWREVLRAVVREGTGRRIDRELILRSSDPERDGFLQRRGIRVPAFGKTGTADDYTNATFVGLLPYFESEQDGGLLDPARSFALAAYVGYDDNRPMISPAGQRITGAAGALPAWLETAQAIVREKAYDLFVDPFDLSYVRTRRLKWRLPEGAALLVLDPTTGLAQTPARVLEPDDPLRSSTPWIAVGGRLGSYAFEPRRRVRPFGVDAPWPPASGSD